MLLVCSQIDDGPFLHEYSKRNFNSYSFFMTCFNGNDMSYISAENKYSMLNGLKRSSGV